MTTQNISRCCKTFVLMLLCAFVVGCGSKEEKVQGQLQYNGAPLPLQDDDELTVTFVHEQGKGSYNATLDKATQSFQLTSPGKEPLPTGPYKIAVTVGSYSQPTTFEGQPLDKLQGRFSMEKTTLRYEVVSGQRNNLVIDVGNGMITAKQ